MDLKAQVAVVRSINTTFSLPPHTRIAFFIKLFASLIRLKLSYKSIKSYMMNGRSQRIALMIFYRLGIPLSN